MAYSSWVSDLKTRSSVGFLGKVVNLLVQAKDRVDLLHTELFKRTTYIVDSELLLASALDDITDGPSNLISLVKPATAISLFGVAGTTTYTLPDATSDGLVKEILYFVDPGQTVQIQGKYRIPNSSGNTTTMSMTDGGDHVKLIWSSGLGAWLVVTGSSSASFS